MTQTPTTAPSPPRGRTSHGWLWLLLTLVAILASLWFFRHSLLKQALRLGLTQAGWQTVQMGAVSLEGDRLHLSNLKGGTSLSLAALDVQWSWDRPPGHLERIDLDQLILKGSWNEGRFLLDGWPRPAAETQPVASAPPSPPADLPEADRLAQLWPNRITCRGCQIHLIHPKGEEIIAVDLSLQREASTPSSLHGQLSLHLPKAPPPASSTPPLSFDLTFRIDQPFRAPQITAQAQAHLELSHPHLPRWFPPPCPI